MKVFLDLDGVLVDFVQGACDLHGRDWPYDDPKNKGPAAWDICQVFDIDPENFWEPMEYDFWRNLDPTPEAQDIVSGLEKVYGQNNIVIFSSPTMSHGCMDGKLDWIREHFPQFSRRFLFGPVKSIVARRGALLVDDYEDHCHAWRAAGGEAILYPRPWNSYWKHDGSPNVTLWNGRGHFHWGRTITSVSGTYKEGR